MGNAVAARRAGQPPLSGQALRILNLKDERLAAMVAGGNDDAFAVLYRRHHQDVYRYCLSVLRQESDARDALQSSMLAALSSLRARPIEGAFKPWLFRIAHNQSISIIRGRAREAPTDAPSSAVAAADQESREEFRTLVSDLGALPERQRGAIVMRELSGLNYTEIAAALGTSEAGGKQLVYEARTAMHDLRAGHEMSCELVRKRISADDRRLLRGRKVRAHLRGCQPCQDFEQAIRRRRTALAALAAPLAPLAAAAVLRDVFGHGGGTGGAGGAGSAAGATSVGSGGAPLAASAGVKLMAGLAIAGAAGFGAYEAASAIFTDDGASTSPAPVEREVSSENADRHGARAGSSDHARVASNRTSGGGAGGGAAAPRETRSGSPDPVPASEAPPAADAAPPGTSPAPSGAEDQGSSGGGSGGGGGAASPPSTAPTPSSPPSSSEPTSPPASPPSSTPPPEPPPAGGGGTGVPPGTPPGHGGAPPGQGGTPPGQAGSDIPPGHLPGHGGGP